MGNGLHLNLESFLPFIHNLHYREKEWAKKKWKKNLLHNEYINEAIFIHFFSPAPYSFHFAFHGNWLCVFFFRIAFFFGHKNENHFKYLFYPNEWTAWTCNVPFNLFNLQHLFLCFLQFSLLLLPFLVSMIET